jgi:hypothetical protein
MKQFDDMRRIGAVVCLLGGVWSLAKGIEMGIWWKGVGGLGLIALGFVLAYYLRRESNSVGG